MLYDILIKYIDHLFILLIIISAHYLGGTFNEKLHHFIKGNHIIKNLLIILTLYFTFDFQNKKEKRYQPLKTFKNSLIIWILYLIIMKMDLHYLLLSIIILIIVYLLENYKKYHKYGNLYYQDIIYKIQIFLINLLIIFMIINLINHYHKHKNKNIIHFFLKN